MLETSPGSASVRGVKLDVRSPHDEKTEMSLGPHCQCAGRERCGGISAHIKLGWKRGRKKHAVTGACSSGQNIQESIFEEASPSDPGRLAVKVKWSAGESEGES